MRLRKIMAMAAASAVAFSALAVAANAEYYGQDFLAQHYGSETNEDGSKNDSYHETMPNLTYDFDGGIYGLRSMKNIRIKDNNAVLLSQADDHKEWVAEGSCMDVMGAGPKAEDYTGCIEQNYDLWSKVDKVSVTFILDATEDDKAYAEANPDELDYSGFFCQGYVQLGGGTDWAYKNDSEVCTIVTTDGTALEDTEEGYFVLGTEYVLEMYPSKMIELYGNDSANSGILAMGLQIGNNGMQWRDDEALYFDITFTGLNIEGDQATIDKYAAIGRELTNEIQTYSGYVTDDPSTDDPSTDDPSTEDPSTDDPSTDAPSTDAPSTDAPSTDKPNTNTGAEGIAVAAGIAVLATGAIVVSKKRK